MAEDLDQKLVEISTVAGDTQVHVTTAHTGQGLDGLLSYFEPTTTAVLLGSSGAGKSTITNWLLGEAAQDVQAVRADDSKGRHTTTTRQLFKLPSGGYLIDTPGMRELSVVESESNQDDRLVEAVESFARLCQFSNCDHEKSSGCAVLQAVEDGELDPRSLENYYKLLRERSWLQDKSGAKNRYSDQKLKRESQARAAATKKRLSRGG